MSTAGDRRSEPVPGWALAGAGVALAAVILEVLGSILGDSPTTAYPGVLVPIAWPTWLRVVTWLVAAGGVAAYHVGMARTDGRRRWLVGITTVGLFASFAVGIALGAPWATWH